MRIKPFNSSVKFGPLSPLLRTGKRLPRQLPYPWLALGIALVGISPASGQPVITPPKINTQPSDGAVARGATFTFRVGATGSSPLSWQWRQARRFDSPVGDA